MKYLYSKVITNKYKHIAQILLTYTKPTYFQYQKNLKLHFKLTHKYKTKNNNLKAMPHLCISRAS
jgi:hypothetical protein